MKILKNKTFDDLNDKIRDLQDNKKLQLQIIMDAHDKIIELKHQRHNVELQFSKLMANSKMNFSIKRVIVGKRASGKTTLIKQLISTMKNYFVISVTDELIVPSKNKFIFIPGTTTYEELENVIKANENKIIILDDIAEQIHLFAFRNEFLYKNDFIMTFQTKRQCELFLRRTDVDFIYDLGTTDEWQAEPEMHICMYIQIPKGL